MHVCSAETNPFMAAFTAMLGLEHVSNTCKPVLNRIFRTIEQEQVDNNRVQYENKTRLTDLYVPILAEVRVYSAESVFQSGQLL